MKSEISRANWLTAMAVHLLTSAGAYCGFMALIEIVNGFLAPAFGWLGVALLIDGIDGTLARIVQAEESAPRWSGATLDLVVDFLTYVLIPLVAVWQAGLLPDAISAPLCGLIASASALYFADTRMKTIDNWFTGFPSLWNIVALYLFCFPLPQWANATILALFCVLMFAPIVFVHPLRVGEWRVATLAVTAAWLAGAGAIVLGGFGPNDWARGALLAGAAWFLALTVRQALRGRSA